MISMYNGGVWGGLCNTEKSNSDSVVSYTLMDSDCNGVYGGYLLMGGV